MNKWTVLSLIFLALMTTACSTTTVNPRYQPPTLISAIIKAIENNDLELTAVLFEKYNENLSVVTKKYIKTLPVSPLEEAAGHANSKEMMALLLELGIHPGLVYRVAGKYCDKEMMSKSINKKGAFHPYVPRSEYAHLHLPSGAWLDIDGYPILAQCMYFKQYETMDWLLGQGLPEYNSFIRMKLPGKLSYIKLRKNALKDNDMPPFLYDEQADSLSDKTPILSEGRKDYLNSITDREKRAERYADQRRKIIKELNTSIRGELLTDLDYYKALSKLDVTLLMLHLAVLNNLEKAATVLLDHGADPNVKTPGLHETPLHIAYSQYNAPMIQLLRKYGANDNLVDKAGYLPSQIVEREDNKQKVFRYLESKIQNVVSKNEAKFRKLSMNADQVYAAFKVKQEEKARARERAKKTAEKSGFDWGKFAMKFAEGLPSAIAEIQSGGSSNSSRIFNSSSINSSEVGRNMDVGSTANCRQPPPRATWCAARCMKIHGGTSYPDSCTLDCYNNAFNDLKESYGCDRDEPFTRREGPTKVVRE